MYLFYLDESGGREYSDETRYFVVCGLGVPVTIWHTLNEAIYALKREYFGQEKVEIKSSWLRYPRDREKRYLLPYGVTPQQLESFTESVYQELLKHNLSLVAAVVDKKAMLQRKPDPEEPLVCTYTALLEQVELFLARTQTQGIIVFDKISSRLWKEGYEQVLASRHVDHQRTETNGYPSRIVEGLLFIPSHESNMIQLADLCAYNIYRQFVDWGEERPHFVNRYPYFAKIEPIFWRNASESYWGYGLSCLPETF